MEYVLTADALTKKYKNFKALNGFSMHVPKGSIYGFVGKNGAGKTTLIIVEIRELILKLNREYQITVLISSHILDELSRLATHYGFIDHGQMVKEINREELEAACGKCIHVRVSATKALSQVLDSMNLKYRILSETEANIYAQINISKLTLALAEKSCELYSVHEKEESLESYYINLVGGVRHD
jgi:ABC-2 type transport system ATP-binding protein